jgi:decaprenylphospho-beta-D-ribofuranose 2-oxidase
MSAASSRKTFLSFDGSESVDAKLFFPDRYRVLENVFNEAGAFAAQGAGLSYAPLSFGPGSSSIQMTQFNRFLQFDPQSGQIEVEAGMSLGTLALFSIPRGWYLKVQPGHPSISVGGCLGADVHGKNQFLDLNFKEQVLFLKIYHPEKGFIHCDRHTHPEVFHLTCGGFGLTGIVISIGIQLGRLVSHSIDTETLRVDDIYQLPALLKARSSTEDLLYSWHDFNTSKNWGWGYLKMGRLQAASSTEKVDYDNELRSLKKAKSLSANSRARLPVNLLNRYSVPLMNKLFSTKELSGGQKTQPLAEFLFPILNKSIYFDLFGRKGFHESQVLIPLDRFECVVRELHHAIKAYSVPVTLASCKLFKGQQELLRFIGEGIVLAFNLPRSSEALRLLSRWDEIVIKSNCLPNIAKDSRLPLEVVQKCYPAYEEFKTRLQSWDSQRRFQTSLSKRLQL